MVAMLSGFGVAPLRSTITHWESRENRRCLNRRSRMGADSTRAYKRLIAHVCEAATDGEWTAIGGGLVYWLIMRGRALASRGPRQPPSDGGATFNVTSLFGVNQRAPMAQPVYDQARQFTDAQEREACEAPTRWPDGHVFPVDIDGDIKRIVISARHLRQFIGLDHPMRARRMPDGSRSAGFTGDTTVYRDLLTVARAYGWVVDAGRRGVEWSPECRSLGRRVMRLRTQNNVTLPSPAPGDEDYDSRGRLALTG
jgi:hypothetical protein